MAKRPTKKAAGSRRRNNRPQTPFPCKLVLNQWLLSLFNVAKFEELAEHLRNEALEGLDENNIHHFHHALTAQFFNLTNLPTAELLQYDQNIVRHTLRLNERRVAHGEEPIAWKYFQYLALLATEIYLDRYFHNPAALAKELNAQITKYNTGQPEADRVTPLDETNEAWPQLNKLAFWMATGSGKTLVMHANILQYQHYLAKHGRGRELNRILLLTPNEGLSQQHLREFEQAGIHAEIFSNESRGLFTERLVEIIEVTKLRPEQGETTFAIEAFEGNNLVLVDEGHRGASGGEEGAWLKARNALCEKGFSFEYSATFQQAVSGNARLTDVYAKSILFNYSYRYFYGDGFGKDYQILNLDEATQASQLELYLVACLLTFFQQQRLYRERTSAFRPFNLERPLWIFVGGSVTKTLAARDASDIVEILKFLSRFVADRQGSIARIDRVLNQGLETAARKNLFAGRFTYLNTAGLTPAQIFDEILATVFNAAGGGQLYVENLKGATGEVALRLGAENDPFGVINVGDDAKLVKLCDEHGLATGEREFAGSLFHDINRPHSTVNVLIGSKKFTEGWSSWRVSTMGLMNVGRGEGAQIIQLFGRGVRLKGIRMSLKRSDKAQRSRDVERPKHIAALETLGIFGIRADYMANFREFLREEGVGETSDDRYYRILIDKSQEEIAAKLAELREAIDRGELKPLEFRGLKAIWFGRHLYQPLLHMQDKIVDISPAALNKGERRFIEDLKAFHDNDGGFFDGKELYVLRNLSKGRGVGFFEAGNFHPDFILWLLVGGRQHVIFVDPKSILHLGADDPKIRFYQTIKEVEQRLGDPHVWLHSFIVSNTPSFKMRLLWGMEKEAMTARHILFQDEDGATYVRAMLSRVHDSGASSAKPAG